MLQFKLCSLFLIVRPKKASGYHVDKTMPAILFGSLSFNVDIKKEVFYEFARQLFLVEVEICQKIELDLSLGFQITSKLF